MRPFAVLPAGLLLSLVAVQAATVAERVFDTGRDTAPLDTGGADTGGADTGGADTAAPEEESCALGLSVDGLLSLACGAVAAATLDLLVELSPEGHLCAVDAEGGDLVCAVVAAGVTGAGSPLCSWDRGTGVYTCRMPLQGPVPGERCDTIASLYGQKPSLDYNIAPSPLAIGSMICLPAAHCEGDTCRSSWGTPRCETPSGAWAATPPPSVTPPPGHRPAVGPARPLGSGQYWLTPSVVPSCETLWSSYDLPIGTSICTPTLSTGRCDDSPIKR